MVLQQLETMLRIQAKGGVVKARITTLEAETQALISAARRDYLFAAAPPMFSRDYVAQFRDELWRTSLENLGSDLMAGQPVLFLARVDFVAQFFLFLAVVFTILRNRQALEESENWRFFAARPFSAGIFISCLDTSIAFPIHGIFNFGEADKYVGRRGRLYPASGVSA